MYMLVWHKLRDEDKPLCFSVKAHDNLEKNMVKPHGKQNLHKPNLSASPNHIYKSYLVTIFLMFLEVCCESDT